MSFRDYLLAGWKLCAIAPGFKGPSGAAARGWNLRENAVTDPSRGPALAGAGLCHAWSGTCALDIDKFDVAAAFLAANGIDLEQLLRDPRSVQISSGREGRAKLLFSLLEPLASLKLAPYQLLDSETGKLKTYHGLELRCASADGQTVQDVLPPTIHPATGKPYEWAYGDALCGHWSNLPPLPDALQQLWLRELAPQEPPTQTAGPVAPIGAELEELQRLLDGEDPDCSYDDWINVLAAVHHETRGSSAGLNLVDAWSRKGAKYGEKKDGKPAQYPADKWRTFRWDAANPITVAWLRSREVAKVGDFPVVVEPTGAAPKPKARFQFQDVTEFVNGEPPVYLIDELLPKGGLGLLYGESGCGKTFFVLDLMMAIAHGTPWCNREVKQGPVMYVCAEGAAGFRKRLRAHERHFGLLLPKGEMAVLADQPNLTKADDVTALVGAMPKRPALIVIDTLAATSAGSNESSSEDMGTVLGNCRAIQQVTGALVLLVHHSGKDAARGARGWSGLRAAVDVELEIICDEKKNRAARVTKMKDGDDAGVFPFKLESVELPEINGKPQTSCVVQYSNEFPAAPPARVRPAPKIGGAQQAVLDFLEKNASLYGPLGWPREALRSEVTDLVPGLEYSNAWHAIRRLQERGLILIENVGGEERVFLQQVAR